MTPHPTGLVESRLLGDGHGRFGGRVRETDRVKARHRALTRSYGEFLAAQLRKGDAGSNTAAGAPRGASLYQQLGWEGLGGRFLGLTAYLDPKGEVDNQHAIEAMAVFRHWERRVAGPA